MSLEIKNLCINVSVAPKSENKAKNEESLRSELLNECRRMVQDAISESRDR
ncbi:MULTISPECIES: DUF5908 family protein [unclassified Fibrobacter]|uniref:DUF5908 family protein n=1 Tax=unclassified Fibrobacter TaxID=2634177 RepID=UPI000910407B|nr:hypothetical protein SAMN05720765_104153 [Fibrobacter sp. UWH6]